MKTLFYEVIVCYDVENNKIRTKLFDALRDFGLIPIQKSVFWGHVNNAEYKAIFREFNQKLNSTTDKAFVVKTRLKAHLQKSGFGYNDYDLPEWKDYETV